MKRNELKKFFLHVSQEQVLVCFHQVLQKLIPFSEKTGQGNSNGEHFVHIYQRFGAEQYLDLWMWEETQANYYPGNRLCIKLDVHSGKGLRRDKGLYKFLEFSLDFRNHEHTVFRGCRLTGKESYLRAPFKEMMFGNLVPIHQESTSFCVWASEFQEVAVDNMSLGDLFLQTYRDLFITNTALLMEKVN